MDPLLEPDAMDAVIRQGRGCRGDWRNESGGRCGG